RASATVVRIVRSLMVGAWLRGGTATSIGSLPHTDTRAAAAFVLRTHPDLPAAPQLPNRSPLEGMLPQWLRALPEVQVGPDGSLASSRQRGAAVLRRAGSRRVPAR